MSFYNLVHGVNPHAAILLGMLGLTSTTQVPRFRDCYWNGEYICLYTRTGGGNRAYYEAEASRRAHADEADPDLSGPYNADLRQLPGFAWDEDDDFDPTYATFYFRPPPAFARALQALRAEDATPAQKWSRFLSELSSGDATPQITRVLETMKPMLEQITKATHPEGTHD